MPTNQSDLSALFDQMQTNMENIAQLMASYYHDLMAKGIPHDLAFALVVEFQRLSFTQRLDK